MNNNTSRKVKNPLLFAAGSGFPFENYTENALLVPVTPATPAVLRDDAELDNFVGQEPVNNNQPQFSSNTYEPPPTNASPPSNESKNTANQPTRQGYFTSILSSLPNLSLSSNKNDSPGTQINQTPENISGTAQQESNPYAFSQERHGSQPDASGFVATNLPSTSSTDLSGFATFDLAGTLPNPPQSTVPPSLSVFKDAPVSYRLGNQRRLKYAPPPDLTSNNAKRYLNPEINTIFPTQSVCTAPPTILNPYESEGSPQSKNISLQQTGPPPEQTLPTSEQISRNSSLHSSFRSSPVATGPAYNNSPVTTVNQIPFSENSSVPVSSQFAPSPARPIPSRLLEPATPQNTPANVSFSSFVPYLNRDLPTINSDKETAAFKGSNRLNSPPEFSKDGISETTVEPANKSSLTLGETDATFTPISAAQVTEKLEHLLAEREESLPREISSEASSEIDEVTATVAAELAKSFEPQSETPQAANEFIERPYEVKTSNTEEKTAHSTNNTLSDVFLGQKSAALSVTRPEVYAADNNPIVTDIQATKSNTHPAEQYSQVQPTSTPCSIFQPTNKPADQKSSLNYVPFVRPVHQNIFYAPLKPTEQSASVYFESTVKSTDQPPDQSSQKNNWNPPVVQSVVDGAYNQQQVQEISAFNSATDSTTRAQFWTADRSSQSQALNVASGNQSTSVAPNQPPPPTFYNPAEFAVKQLSTFSSDQYPAQQQPSQSAPLYESTSSFQQIPAVHENNTAYPLSVVSMAAVPEPTGSATLSPVQMSTNSLNNRSAQDTIPPSFQNLASGSPEQRIQYRPVYHHWFYRKEVETKTLWHPFSMQDSLKLEEVHNSSEITTETTVATDGGRYDVSIMRRQRAPVYWTGASNEVRRCSWFHMGPVESKYVPYDEKTATRLEEEYKLACVTNVWNRRVELNNGEYILFHSATVQVHYLQPNSSDLSGSWGNSTGSADSTYLQGIASRPKVVKRGVSDFNIDEGEPENVDHLLFLVHGIGSVCDLKFRSVEEVVDEFRSISLQLVQSHYRTASMQGIVNRIEVLPISWHATLHSGDTGIDKKLQAITLESIPKLRHFTNDTLLDILFYTSPVYCQTIMQTVGSEMNRLHALFKERNPTFDGGIYIGGHSLGSLILFDLLCHQKPIVEKTEEENDNDEGSDKGEDDSVGPIQPMPKAVLKRRLSKRINYVMGAAGTGQPFIHYPQLNFHPGAFFALGSPIGMFVTVRGIDTLGEDFVFPTCPAFFNIFHPFDPVAYRMESLIYPDACKYRPMLIPHHKGRKRMHLELKETMARVGADLKQKVLDSVKNTWNSIFQLSMFYKPDNQALANEIDKVVEEQLQQSQNEMEQRSNDDEHGANITIGKLNGGRRIDYVLQEAPFEYINEYIFALTSHICYWESEDTMLLILKEIYGSMGIQTDAQLPQQTMSIERVSPSPSLNLSALLPSGSNVGTSSSVMGVDPTVPISNKTVGPPPKAGFVRKS